MGDLLLLLLGLGLGGFFGYNVAGQLGSSFSEKAKNYFMLNRDV